MTHQQLVRQLITAIGDNPDREGVTKTPDRVVRSWKELYGGYACDPAKILGTTFRCPDYDEMVVLSDIEFYSTCEHHMIPFYGKAHIGYIPNKRVVGLSKLARLVDCFSRRLQIQEHLTDQIAQAITNTLKPKGVMVVLKAKHMCMCMRGVNKQQSIMTTSSISGEFKKEGARAEFLSLVKS